jgi:hypothetical protein
MDEANDSLSFDKHDFSDDMNSLLIDEFTDEDFLFNNGFEGKSYDDMLKRY